MEWVGRCFLVWWMWSRWREGYGGPEESSGGPGAVECVWGLNQPEPDCNLIQLSSGAPEAPTGTVAKPHPWPNQVSPVSVGT